MTEENLLNSYRIAIIEDDDKDAAWLTENIQRYFGGEHSEYEIKRFSSPASFFDKYVSYFDIVLIDIEMPNMSGLEASKRLREVNGDVVIIFVTNLAQYAVEGYAVNAFDFIIKPVEYGNFSARFKRALNFVNLRSQKIVIRLTDNVAQTVPVSQIKYIEVFSHMIIYHTLSGDFEVRGTLAEAENKLKNYGFYKCNNCYLVNLKFVDKVDGTTAVVCGEKLAVSRRKKKDFLEAITHFYGEGI